MLALAAAGVAVAAEAERIRRDPRELVVALAGEPGEGALRLLEAFVGDHTLSLRAVSADPVLLGRLLRRGEVDLVLLAGTWGAPDRLPAALGRWQAPGPELFESLVPAVRFLHPLRELTAAEALDLLEGKPPARSGDAACFPLELEPAEAFLADPSWRAVSLLAPWELEARVQALTVEGVEPTWGNLAKGAYPLSRRLHVLTRLPGRPLGLDLAWPETIRRRYDPNADLLAAFLGFLNTPAAVAALAGEGPPVTVAAVGDIMLGRGVGRLIAERGVDYPFEAISGRVRAADVGFANLESPFGTTGRALPGKMIWFRADPAAASGLRDAGFNVLTLANNHILDYDTECLLETLAVLDAHGIRWAGAGRHLEEAMAPALVTVNGVTLAFLGFSDFAHIYWSESYPRTFAATADRPGVAPADRSVVARAIAEARKVADFVIVAFHWGDEYVNYPNATQLETGRHAIAAGADLVLGSHPHAVQGFEFHRGGFIAYSLGNFIMDQRRPIQCETMILEIEFLPSRVRQIRVVPAYIEDARPAVLGGEEAAAALDKLRLLSLPFLGD